MWKTWPPSLAFPVANVSQHLQVLRIAQMVEIRREGSRKFYRVADEEPSRFGALYGLSAKSDWRKWIES